MMAFVVGVLKVRTLDIGFFVDIKKKLNEGNFGNFKRKMFVKLKFDNFMLNPSCLIVTNYGNKIEQIIKAKYVFYLNKPGEKTIEINVDYFFEQNVIVRRNRFSIYMSQNKALFNLSKLLETDAETCKMTITLSYLNFSMENLAFPIRKFAKNGNHEIRLSGPNFPTCVNFLLLLPEEDPYGEKHQNASYSLLSKEKFNYSSIRPSVTNRFLSVFFPTENGFVENSKRFKLLKKQFETFEFTLFANSFLNKLPLIELLMKGKSPKEETRLLESDFETKLSQYCFQNKENLKNVQLFEKLILSLSLFPNIKHKSQIFVQLIEEFGLKNAAGYAPFVSADEFQESIKHFLTEKLFKEKINQKSFVFFALTKYIKTISNQFELVNSDPNLYYNFLLFPVTVHNLYFILDRETEINKEFFKTKFLEMHLLKVYIKLTLPDLYSHFIRLGSSIEDLFMYDLLTFFVDSFSLNFAVNVQNFYSVLEAMHEDKHFLIVLFNLYLIEALLKKYQQLLFNCKTSAELFECKKNIFKFHEFSSASFKTDDFFCKIVTKIISLPQENKEQQNTQNAKPNTIFSSFESFADYLTEVLEFLEHEYSEIEFEYFELQDVQKLFNEIKTNTQKSETNKNLSKAKKPKANFGQDLVGSSIEDGHIQKSSLLKSKKTESKFWARFGWK